MGSVYVVLMSSITGAMVGALTVWFGLQKSKQIRVKRLITHLNNTNKDLAGLREKVALLEHHVHDPNQFQRRVMLGISEVAHRLAMLDLNVAEDSQYRTDLPESPFPGE